MGIFRIFYANARIQTNIPESILTPLSMKMLFWFTPLHSELCHEQDHNPLSPVQVLLAPHFIADYKQINWRPLNNMLDSEVCWLTTKRKPFLKRA